MSRSLRHSGRWLLWGSAAVLAAITLWHLNPFQGSFAGMDHPFHVSRAETLRRSLADGASLRWVAHHQGGYPVEFYPLGIPYVTVALWALTLGSVSMATAHHLVVVALFLAPVVAFVELARRDTLPPSVALAASAAHLLLASGPYQGGYRELVEWGMVTNVGAATAALFFIVPCSDYVSRGNRRGAVRAALLAAAAAWINPRSLVAIASAAAGVLVSPPATGTRWPVRAGRLLIVAGVAVLLAAPECVSFARFAHLYHFVHFTGYADVAAFARAALESTGLPVLVLTAVGIAAALRRPGLPAARCAAAALATHVGATLLVHATGAIPQLEATRLMPFQRLLSLYLFAVGLHALTRRRALLAQLAAVPAVVFVSLVLNPIPWRKPLNAVDRTARPELQDFAEAIETAASTARPGTAILVMGSAVSIHQALWAPAIRDGLYFYDDWLWDWHTAHAGPYDAHASHAYARTAWPLVLAKPHLDDHAIGTVVVLANARSLAEARPHLERTRRGRWFDVYAVRAPRVIVTWPGGAPRPTMTNHRITASGASAGGPATIRRTWHPRWHASVNGQATSVRRRVDDYMEVDVPPGQVRLDLSYVLDAADVMARAAMLAGLVAVAALWRSERPRPAGERTGDVATQLPSEADAPRARALRRAYVPDR